MVHTALDHNLDMLTASCAEAGGAGVFRPPSVINLTAVPPALPAPAFDASVVLTLHLLSLV